MATRTCTVVFTDLANYTASVGRSDREGLRNLIAMHEKLVAPVLERFGGRIVKNLGDSYMALFPAATDAVRSSVELVDTIPNKGTGLSIRAAMATGDVEVIDGDAFGEAVNLAARLLSRTPDAEIWMSAATHLCMNLAEIAWEPVGRHTLKGIASEVEVFRAVTATRAMLPEPVSEAVRTGRLVRIQRGDPLPALPPRPIILLEGFVPASPPLRDVVDRLPVVDPASLWLAAYNIPPGDRIEWQKAGRGLVIGQPAGIDRAILETARPRATAGTDTIILDGNSSFAGEIMMAGLALPSVPMSEVVAGYTYDLLSDGRWVNRSDSSVARVDVSTDTVALTMLAPGVTLAGRQMSPGKPVILEDGDRISIGSGLITYRALHQKGYAGLLISDSLARLGVMAGQQAEVGREPNYPGLALPDRRGQDNVRWCVGARAARARESGFTLDRALAGRRHCAFCAGPGGVSVVSLHERCHTYVLADGRLDIVASSRPVEPGDLIIAGTSVIELLEPAN